MAEKKKNAWFASLLVTIVGGLAVEYVKGFPVSRWIAGAVRAALGWLRVPYTIERWYLAIITIAAVVPLIRTAVRIVRRGEKKRSYTDYRSDQFVGMRWRWTYSDGQFDPFTLTAFCPLCNLVLTMQDRPASGWGTVAEVRCVDCGYKHTFSESLPELRRRITLLVDRNLRDGSWEKILGPVE